MNNYNFINIFHEMFGVGRAKISREIIRDLLRIKFPALSDNSIYIKAGIEWICAAQDSSGDGGVARDFSLLRGWNASYPETTGYIIPTMFDYYHLCKEDIVRRRALRMANWLADIQLPSGGIQAGTVAEKRVEPTIFNTGQVLFGWVRAYEETQDKYYLDAIQRAADWLIHMQDEDGAWRRASSPCTAFPINTYNTRTAWALLRAFTVTGNISYKKACMKNIEWAITQQKVNGWFDNNCLNDHANALIHTIAYAVQGILEVGLYFNNLELIEKAQKAADVLIKKQGPYGSLAGRYNNEWMPAVSWSCLTGDAQCAIIWQKLFLFTKENKYLIAAKKANNFLKTMINLNSYNEGIHGGVKGAYPIWSPYGKYQYLNWATKFFIDSLILENKNSMK